MCGLAAALLITPLLVVPATAMAQGVATTRINPFSERATSATPAAPSSQPPLAPRTAQPQTTVTTTGANQFASEDAARQACGADTVVRVNTGGFRAWHVSGDRYYGHTKRGACMCERVARQAGYHASSGTARAPRAGGQTR